MLRALCTRAEGKIRTKCTRASSAQPRARSCLFRLGPLPSTLWRPRSLPFYTDHAHLYLRLYAARPNEHPPLPLARWSTPS
jgi:hypothetical protein